MLDQFRTLRGVMSCALVGLLAAATFAQADPAKEPAKDRTAVELRRAQANATYFDVRGDLPQERVIYGTDDRRDVYELTEPDLIFYQQAACVVVDRSEITQNGDGTWNLSTAPFNSASCGTLCTDEPFRGQLTIGFCSGFLVGSDVLVTAGHCVSASDCGSVAFIFGFDQQGPVTPPQTSHVPAENVYFCDGIINRVQSGDLDHCVLRLDRPVVGRTPLPVRRSGLVANDTPLVMIGHPVTLPKKIDDGGVVKDNNGSTGWFYANVDAYGGNSGSMVINRNTGEIEGILVRGNTDFTSSGGCCRSNVCPDSGCSDWEEISKTISFASFIPELGMQVTPAGGVTHVGIVGGPFFTNPTTNYTLGNPTSSALNYTVALSNDGVDFLRLDGGSGPLSGAIPAGGPAVNVAVSIDPTVANALPAGVYTKDVVFEDTTNGLLQVRTHTLEVGQTGFTVTPADGLETGGPVGGPFTASKSYTLTSTRPTPVTIDVAGDAPWIAVDGAAGTSVMLNGVGDAAMVTVGFSAAADGLAAGLYTGSVDFANLTQPGNGDTGRPVVLDVGRFTYVSSDTPQNINDNQSVTSQISVADAFCIGDVNIEVDITHTFIGDLIVELTSPEGTTVRLHNRTGSGADNLVLTYDDSGTPPDGPGALADFNGELVTGVWTLFVSDNAGGDVGTLNAWKLKIASSPAACPPVAQDLFVNVPHTVTSAIPLAAASPNGPFSLIVVSLPSHGTLSDPQAGPITSVPYTLVNQGDVVDYRPAALYVGDDLFTYQADDGVALSNLADVNIEVGLREAIYDFPLDTNPGWTTTGQWAFGQPTGAGSRGADPTGGHTGTNVYGYNLNGDYTDNMPEYPLTTGALDLTSVVNTQIEFWRWLGVESATYDHAAVQVSVNNGPWQTIWTHTGASLYDGAWVFQSFDISALADNQPNVRVRWVMGTTDGSVVYCGWNIDDIRIVGVRPPTAVCVGELTGDGAVDLSDLGVLLGCWQTPCGDLTGDNNTDLADLGVLLGDWGCSTN